VLTHFRGVSLQDAILQVTRSKVKDNVEEIKKVGKVVETEPHEQRLAIYLLECETKNDDPKVVEEC
jgi:hypothetical protein